MVSAKDAEVDKVVGLELGADDYVTKPYSPRELVARIRAVLRRGRSSRRAGAGDLGGPARSGWTSTGTSSRSRASEVRLPLKEFELLRDAPAQRGRVLTRGQLIDRVWGADYVGDTKTLDVHVKRLRAKIEPDPAAPALPRDGPRPRLQVRRPRPCDLTRETWRVGARKLAGQLVGDRADR